MDAVLLVVLTLVSCVGVRWVYCRLHGGSEYSKASTMIVLGSGGHTCEMLKLLSDMDPEFYAPRVFVVADTDMHSSAKAHTFERTCSGASEAKIETIKRSREVGQSFFTSAFTTTAGCISAIGIALRHRPALLLLNGPGTCIPICLVVRACNLVGLWSSKVVFLESIARVDSLSLSGKILYRLRLTDVFLVQWKELVRKYPRAEYADRLF